MQIALTDVVLGGVVFGLYSLGKAFGWAWLVKTYGIPLLMVNFWLVMITMLQHTHPALPHYKGEDWDWLRGALATVDRNYGWFLNHVHHHIADTHVCHHLFSQIPFYHAQVRTYIYKLRLLFLIELYCILDFYQVKISGMDFQCRFLLIISMIHCRKLLSI